MHLGRWIITKESYRSSIRVIEKIRIDEEKTKIDAGTIINIKITTKKTTNNCYKL